MYELRSQWYICTICPHGPNNCFGLIWMLFQGLLLTVGSWAIVLLVLLVDKNIQFEEKKCWWRRNRRGCGFFLGWGWGWGVCWEGLKSGGENKTSDDMTSCLFLNACACTFAASGQWGSEWVPSQPGGLPQRVWNSGGWRQGHGQGFQAWVPWCLCCHGWSTLPTLPQTTKVCSHTCVCSCTHMCVCVCMRGCMCVCVCVRVHVMCICACLNWKAPPAFLQLHISSHLATFHLGQGSLRNAALGWCPTGPLEVLEAMGHNAWYTFSDVFQSFTTIKKYGQGAKRS